MNISSSNVIASLFVYAPQFYTTDPDRLAYLNLLYDLVRCQVNAKFIGCCAVSAFALLMAHYLTLAANPNLGLLSNISEGDLSLGYNVASDMTALQMTPYGRSYLDLIKRSNIGSTVTNLPVGLGGVAQNPGLNCGCYGGGWGYGNAY